ncbi:HPr family phosphocarrier protein [Niallia taxi]|uniref:HPr family phosphocarrier protein n=1 Tax=Niallia taxi TaxID=2499688 RepID=UPI002E22BBD8|nr:HPr family phosphocarrier protein [Niallia taxi]
MLKSQVIVKLKRGLQARNTVKFFVIAASFECEIHIIHNGVTCGINLMDIMNLNVLEEDEIMIVANGKDEIYAISALKQFLSEGQSDVPLK